MFGELSWPHVDRIIECYGVASTYAPRLPELETAVSQMANQLIDDRPSIQDFSDLLVARSPSNDNVSRKAAWAGQHAYQCRAWAVGHRVVQVRRQGKNVHSPLIAQLKRLGHKPSECDLLHLVQEWDKLPCSRQETLDAMLVAPSKNEVILAKGICHRQAKASDTSLWLNAKKDCLFGQDDRFATNLFCKTEIIGTLLFAKEILTHAFPQLTISAKILFVDDPPSRNNPASSWAFQSHDVTQLKPEEISGRKFCLDDSPVDLTHESIKRLEDFDYLPNWSTNDPLNAAPVDRPVRSLMLLNELWCHQRSNPRKLAILKSGDLCKRVEDKYSIELPKDLLRHDLEDCLERGGFFERPNAYVNAYALTPKGVGRLLLMNWKFNRMLHRSPQDLLEAVAAQAERWADTVTV